MARKKSAAALAAAAAPTGTSAKPPPQRGLLDDDSDSGEGDDAPALRINDAYAKRFQARLRRLAFRVPLRGVRR